MIYFLILLAGMLEVPQIQVIDLEGGEPRHLVVIIDGEPFKVTSIPGGSGPAPPGPSPVPPPAPEPAPVVGPLWITYIQPAVPTVADSTPLSDAPLRARIDGVEVRFRAQTVGDAELTRRKFDQIAKDAPVTVFQDQSGKILKTLKGNDPSAILSGIKVFKIP